MSEEFAQVGEITLCYETMGDPADPSLLLVMGLGAQMIAWPDDFCAALVESGFHVIRFDNRDVGRSTILRDRPPPTPMQVLRRRGIRAPYRLEDMADDAAGLLDHLEIDSAHVVGASMGGMIAQTIAIRHPDRVRSLTSIMSTTGSRRAGQPAWRLYPALIRAAPNEREAFIAHATKMFKVVGSRGVPGHEEEMRDLIARSFDRGHTRSGVLRQAAAIMASGERTAELRKVRVPAVVIHGTIDLLVRVTGGRATARAIPGARLIEIPNMGHDLPRAFWPRFIEGIVDVARRAGDDVAAEAEPAAA